MRRLPPPILVAVILAIAQPALAHHILGIPHYAYDERYPQVPVLTYKFSAGRYLVEMTGYPGIPQPGEQCFLNVYVTDASSGEPYTGDVTLEVLRDRLLGPDPVVYGPTTAAIEESVYKFYPRFAAEANYLVRIRFDAEGAPWIVDLPVVVGAPGSPWRVLIGVLGGAALFLLVIRALRIKRRRSVAAGRPTPAAPTLAQGASR